MNKNLSVPKKTWRLHLCRIVLMTALLVFLGAGPLVFAGGQKEQEAASPDEEKGTISYWSWMPRPETQYPFLLKAWEVKHPNLKIDFGRLKKVDYLVKLKTSMLGGVGPDVFAINLGDSARPYIEKCVPLKPYAEKSWGSGWEKSYLDLAIEWSKVYGDDFPYMPVTMISAPLIVYDAVVIEKAGVGSLSTYDDYVSALKKLKAISGILPHIGAGLKEEQKTNWTYFTLIEQIEPGAFMEASEAKRSWTDGVFKKALLSFKKLFDDGVFQKGALSASLYPDITYDSFVNDVKFPMITSGSFFMGEVVPSAKEVRGTTDRRFGVAPFPNLGGGDPVVLTAVDQALAINVDSKQKDLAWLFIEFMATDYQHVTAKLMEQFPAMKGVGLDSSVMQNDVEKKAIDNMTKLVLNNAKSATSRLSIEYPELAKSVYDNVQSYLLGMENIDAALEKIESVSKKIDR